RIYCGRLPFDMLTALSGAEGRSPMAALWARNVLSVTPGRAAGRFAPAALPSDLSRALVTNRVLR
ncbi:MAG: hypothetical protein R6V05_00955, partial [Candidatus Brocadiia bacterium]